MAAREIAGFRSLSGFAAIYAIEIVHASVPDSPKFVNDAVGHRINGDLYLPVIFRPIPPSSRPGQPRRSSMSLDNVGRPLMEWIEDTNGGRGAKVRMMRIVSPVLDTATFSVVTVSGIDIKVFDGVSIVTWEATFNMALGAIRNQAVAFEISDVGLDGRPAILRRFDPDTYPGLYEG